MLLNLREEYEYGKLDLEEVSENPILQFHQWFQEALSKGLPEPYAMTLATANAQGRPSARTVLMRSYSDDGFVFFTNYDSRKGQDLSANPCAALLFFWAELQRQVRIEGVIEKISRADSEAYFQSRPKGSQIGAWASPQSCAIAGRHVLEEQVRALSLKYENVDRLPLPDNWGGYLLRPDSIEFWQGRPSRLHDRIHYARLDHGSWKTERLAP